MIASSYDRNDQSRNSACLCGILYDQSQEENTTKVLAVGEKKTLVALMAGLWSYSFSHIYAENGLWSFRSYLGRRSPAITGYKQYLLTLSINIVNNSIEGVKRVDYLKIAREKRRSHDTTTTETTKGKRSGETGLSKPNTAGSKYDQSPTINTTKGTDTACKHGVEGICRACRHRIKELARQGMKESWARAEVTGTVLEEDRSPTPAPEHAADCLCLACVPIFGEPGYVKTYEEKETT